MALNHPTSSVDVSKIRRNRKYLTVEEKMKVLHMLEEGKSFRAVAPQFRVSISTISRIKMLEEIIRKKASNQAVASGNV